MIPDPILFFRRLAVNIFYLGEALVYGIRAIDDIWMDEIERSPDTTTNAGGKA